MPAQSLATRFYQRFVGLSRTHGHFRPNGTERERDGKQEGFTETIHAPVTEELWQGHLDGVYGLGIVPINDAGMCRWGAIDIDLDQKPDLIQIASDILRMELPLMVCRSKSGAAHAYLFTSEDVPAPLLRGKLMEWAVALGYSGVEVFPKQIRLASAKDYGNWINLPYFNATGGTARYSIHHDGRKLTAKEFLDEADALAVSLSELESLGGNTDLSMGDLLHEAPPCLQSIARKGGAGDGNTNRMLFNVGVYLRKRHGDQWESQFDQYNAEPFVNNPRSSKEMVQLTRSINRKTYEYTCNEPPCAQHCNRQICLTRKFGIGGGDDDSGVVFGGLVKIATEPPTWIWDVDGMRLELTTEQLKDQGRFHTTCIDVLNKWPRPMKPVLWTALIREKLEHVEVIPAPPDAKPEGMMWSHLQTYCTGRATARKREELLHDKPWMPSPEEAEQYSDQVVVGRVYFRAGHFKQYLQQNRVDVSEKRLWTWLRGRGALHHEFNIKGKYINCWSVAAFAQQTEPFHVPRVGDEDM